ncbi:MAG: type II secretion system F family protein, partial [Phycisphaerae bacterium]
PLGFGGMRVIASHNSDGQSVKVVGAEAGTRFQSRAGAARAAAPSGIAGARRRKPFSETDLVAFFSNTATLVNSGVPLIKTLEALATDDSLSNSAPTLETLARDIRSGSSFSTALSKHPDCFSPMIISLVRAGETSGTLPPALERIAENIEKRRETKAQIRQALTYPAIVSALGVAAVVFLMIFVVPVFEETYAKAGMPLPLITQALIAVSRIAVNTWWIGLGLLTGAVLLYRHFRQHSRVQAFQDRLLLRLPLLGPIVRSAMVGRFVEAFGSLLAAGLSIKEALTLTERVVRHSEYAGMVRELRLAVARGEGLGSKLSEYRSLFPPLLTRMMSLGEKSGELGKMAVQVSRYTEKDLKRRAQRMSTLVEPLVTVAMAFVIGAIALAIYLPIFDMFKQVAK